MIRWYISPYSGTGTPFDPFHAAAWDLIDPVKDFCEGTFCPNKRHYLVRVKAPQEVHDEIIAKEAGTPIGRIFKDEPEEDKGLAETFINNVKLDDHDFSWVTEKTTMKEVLNYLTKSIMVSQKLASVSSELFSLPLDAKAVEISASQKTGIANFISSKDLGIAVTDLTTVRELKHQLVSTAQFNKIQLAGKEL